MHDARGTARTSTHLLGNPSSIASRPRIRTRSVARPRASVVALAWTSSARAPGAFTVIKNPRVVSSTRGITLSFLVPPPHPRNAVETSSIAIIASIIIIASARERRRPIAPSIILQVSSLSKKLAVNLLSVRFKKKNSRAIRYVRASFSRLCMTRRSIGRMV